MRCVLVHQCDVGAPAATQALAQPGSQRQAAGAAADHDDSMHSVSHH
jgi:hypothetical protein